MLAEDPSAWEWAVDVRGLDGRVSWRVWRTQRLLARARRVSGASSRPGLVVLWGLSGLSAKSWATRLRVLDWPVGLWAFCIVRPSVRGT